MTTRHASVEASWCLVESRWPPKPRTSNFTDHISSSSETTQSLISPQYHDWYWVTHVFQVHVAVHKSKNNVYLACVTHCGLLAKSWGCTQSKACKQIHQATTTLQWIPYSEGILAACHQPKSKDHPDHKQAWNTAYHWNQASKPRILRTQSRTARSTVSKILSTSATKCEHQSQLYKKMTLPHQEP